MTVAFVTVGKVGCGGQVWRLAVVGRCGGYSNCGISDTSVAVLRHDEVR